MFGLPRHSSRSHLDALRAGGSVFPEEELAALAVAARTRAELADLVRRRAVGEPVEHLVGHADFAGLRLRVAPGVFVPRPRTELLARLAADRVRPGERLLDLGCGAGTVAAYVASRVAGVLITAVDADPRALECARANLPPDARLVRAVTPDALPSGAYHVVAANLPYVPSARLAFLPSDARDHEPRLALDGGSDGLDPLRAYVGGLPRLLLPGGRFLVEVSRSQARLARRLLADVRLTGVRVHRDEDADATVVEACRE